MLVSKVFHNIATLELFHNEIVTGFQLESNGNADYFCKSCIVGKFTQMLIIKMRQCYKLQTLELVKRINLVLG